MPKNAGRKGRRLGPYRRGKVTPVHVSFLSAEEMARMEWESAPTTARVLDVSLLDVSLLEAPNA